MAANWLRFDWHRKLASIAVDGCAGNGWNVSPGHGSGFDGIHGRFKKSISMSHLIFLSVMFFSVKEPEPESARIPESTLPKNPPRILQESSKNPPISSNILQYPPISSNIPRKRRESHQCFFSSSWESSRIATDLKESQKNPSWIQNKSRMHPNWISNESQMNLNWILVGSEINAKWIPVESQLNPSWIPNESQMSPRWISEES